MMKGVYSESKLAFHRGKLEALSERKITAPVYVRIKPTNQCNHSCSYCSYAPGSDCPVSETINLEDKIAREKMLEILSDFKDMGVKAVTYSGGGEPLIYPHITEVFEKTLEHGIDLSIITNGQKLNGRRTELLAQSKWVRVSSSESDAKTFSEIRKRPESWFNELVDNIEKFAKAKNSDCELGINFVVHKRNANQIYRSTKFFRDLGVNHIKITPTYTPNFEEYHEPIKKQVMEQIEKARQDFETGNFTIYDTYENDFKLTGLSERTYPKCYIMQIIPVIGADNVVYFCHDKTYTKNGSLGSIKDVSFKELWFSERVARIFMNFDPRSKCRHHCTYDSRNILIPKMLKNLKDLDKLKPKEEKHKNFV